MKPNYPIYIVSKGRWESRLTSKALEKMDVPYHIVIEPQEYGEYSKVIDPAKILQLPFSNLGQGSIPARNWIWEHALTIGKARHWILDDNIRQFFRLNRNIRIPIVTGTVFKIAEDFTDRYENVAISGLQYYMFCPDREEIPPYYLNTRVYSCILIKNDIPYRWRGRYNEDTDLSIRALKDGWCTILINTLLAEKMATLTMKGGNMEELYKDDGRLKMAQSLQEQHPDIVKITQKWGRWQHQVDYSFFKKNKLIRKPGLIIKEGINNYGLVLRQINNDDKIGKQEPIKKDKPSSSVITDFFIPSPINYPKVEPTYPDLSGAKYISIDVETKDPGIKLDGLSALKKEGYILGFSIGTNDGFKAYYPLKHPGGENVDRDKTLAWLKAQMALDIPKVGANILYDLEWMHYDFNIKVNGRKIDIQAIEALLDETRKSYTLNSIARDRLNLVKKDGSLYKEADRLGINYEEIKANLWQMPAGAVRPYGEGDADLPIQILKKQLILIGQQEMDEVFNLECDILDVLFGMRLQGLRVNMNYAEQLKNETALKEKEARARLREIANREIDIWSGADLAAASENLGLKFPVTVKQNPSFTNDWLETQPHKFFLLVKEVRKYNRLLKIFIESKVLDLAYNSRIYPSYYSTRRDGYGTRTGRLSSANPNIQQVPARDEELAPLIRSMFIPEEEEDWETYDYNQQEPRMLVHFANLCKLSGAAEAKRRYIENPDTDYHQLTANLANISRKYAKIINLGLTYGMGRTKLASELGLPLNEANIIFDKYHEALPYVKDFTDLASRLAENRGWVKTALGRRRHFEAYGPYKYEKGVNPLPYKEALGIWGTQIKRWFTYKAGNSIISGSSADLTKKAMVDVYKAVGKVPLITVHDENDYSNKDPKIRKIILECMLNALKLEVPLKVDVETGPAWGKTKGIKC